MRILQFYCKILPLKLRKEPKNPQVQQAPRFRIYKRIDRLAEGNPGDVKPIGEGCSEMRIDYGPGYRVYYKDTGNEITILLCGGEKTTQQADIAQAKEIARNYNPDEDEE
jgi:putative addiction module killer protein